MESHWNAVHPLVLVPGHPVETAPKLRLQILLELRSGLLEY
jgi:hypothetical protein